MITLNTNPIPQQPSYLNEDPEKIKTDTHAINGTRKRMQSESKKKAVFTISHALPATYQFIKALYDAADTVDYHNDESNVSGGVLEFTGTIDFDESPYYKGGSRMVDVTVTIREE